MKKHIILVGPTASGKNYIREKFHEKGYKIDVSYTTRRPRESEVDGIDYKFISKKVFERMIALDMFYEYVKYNDNYYGTGMTEWHTCDIFIMETDGISKIKPKDRKKCLVIFVNTPLDIRIKRMKERGWNNDKVYERVVVDQKKFKNFVDYDFEISSESH